MKNKEGKMELIAKMWAPLALEYADFLGRYKIATVSVITGRINLGIEISIFANEDEYLNMFDTSEQFAKDEEQITRMLDVIEELSNIASACIQMLQNIETEEFYESMNTEFEEDNE